MPESTSCTSWPTFLLSLSPALGAVLSATALLVASLARSTSKDAQSTSQQALAYSAPPSPGSSVVLSPDLVEVLRKHSSSKAQDRRRSADSPPGPTYTSPGSHVRVVSDPPPSE